MKAKNQKELDDLASLLTGIDPIVDYEYQRLIYSHKTKGKSKQERKELFKATKRII